MVVRRATRFTPKPPTDSISVISAPTVAGLSFAGTSTAPTVRPTVRPTITVVRPPPTPIVTTTPTRATRVTRAVSVFRPPTITPRTPTPRPPTVTRVTTPTRATRVTRAVSVFRPPTRPPRDDFQRSLSVFPVVRQAFAQEPPRQIQVTPRPSVPFPSVAGFVEPRPSFTPVRTRGKVVKGEFRLSDEQRAVLRSQPKVPIEIQQAETQRLRDLGALTFEEAQRQEGLSGFERAFASFGGGVTQEVSNLGAIAGIGTFREEAGSLAIELPFAVAGETFTRPSQEQSGGLLGGGGFLGLGFDFRKTADFEAGFEKSGFIQDKIRAKFAEDPARALGSVFAVATIETAIFVGTGGAGRLALAGAKKFAQVKGRKIALKVSEKLSEKDVGRAVENLGKGEFLITQGTSAGAKRGIIIGKLDSIAIGLKKQLNPVTATFKQVADNIVLTKTPTLRGATKATIKGVTKGGKKGKIPSKRALGLIEQGKEAKIPVIHVNTRAIINGKRQTVVTLFTKEQIQQTGFPTQATIRGLTNPKLLNRLGLEKVGETATTAQGKLKGGAVRELRIAEESGAIRLAGEGVQFLATDIFANPKTLRQIALTGKTLGGQPAKVSKTVIFEAEALGGAKFVRETGKGIGNIGISFGSKAEARELAKLGLGDVGRIPKKQGGKPFDFAKVDELGDLGKVFGSGTGAEVTKVVAGAGKRTAQTVARPTQATDDIANIFRQVSKETTKPATRNIFSPTGSELGTALGIRTGLRTDFGNIFRPPRQRQRVREDSDLALGVIPAFRSDEGFKLQQDLGAVIPIPTQQRVIQTVIPQEDLLRTPEFVVGEEQITTPRTGIIPRLDQPFTPFQPPVTRPKTPPITPTGLGGGLPTPFFPPSEAERKRRGTGKKRRSRLGGRLFDIADEPFGEVAVGLGFFVETERGETSIEEALGFNGDDEPITRQEKQARARLGRGKGRRKRRDNIDDIFDVGGLFG